MNAFSESRWWKAGSAGAENFNPERFLKRWEPYCVSACARYLRMSGIVDRLWVLQTGRNTVSALLFQSRGTLFPVFGRQERIHIPPHISRALQSTRIFSLQGVKNDVDILEEALLPLDFRVNFRQDFDLLTINPGEAVIFTKKPPEGLRLRFPTHEDFDEILELHANYEQEEVILDGEEFNPLQCAARLEGIFRHEKLLAAELEGHLVGKINTTAASFSRSQIGGVFVSPEYRCLGIGHTMTAAFARLLLDSGQGVSLFVKKTNKPARRVYYDTGFKKAADYSIAYL